MALETNGAYLDSVSAEADTGRVNWEKAFQRSEKEHTLRVAENATKSDVITFKTEFRVRPSDKLYKIVQA